MRKPCSALKDVLVVSCQAAPGDPLENVNALRRIALACLRGGRRQDCDSTEGTALPPFDPIRKFPIIGLKKAYLDGRAPNYSGLRSGCRVGKRQVRTSSPSIAPIASGRRASRGHCWSSASIRNYICQ